ncbi:MAG: indole-3-glycerol phosphate synthase TrpC [Vicinamibacteria bacterium]|nr:indole-3-glycerol phosphate synthase TrpC [Vicinamibacteria bacterium]
MRDPGGALARILAATRERVDRAKAARPTIEPRATAPARVSFTAALTRPGHVRVIAEHKRRSPSRGAIREDLSVAEVARGYEAAGAAALSVLTEPEFFGGDDAHLAAAREAAQLPLLRKDFTIDAWQVAEAAALGADAVLLIAAALDDSELRELLRAAHEHALDALVEVHDREELHRSLRAGARIVGVNNRDLRSLQVDLATAFALAPEIPEDVIAVAESGLRSGSDLRRLREAGFDAFLVGESLMSAPDPGAALAALIAEAEGSEAGPRPSAGPVSVKVCGITCVEDGIAAVEAGAAAVGFVLWPQSPRAVTPEQARRIGAALPPFVTRVGVFVDTPPEAVDRIAAEAGLDVVQLHGDEPVASVHEHARRVIKALRVGPGFDPAVARRFDDAGAAILLDTGGRALPGGTGESFDWGMARALRPFVRQLVLAGGLHAGNVAAAIAETRPDAVDVSSGVEAAPGRKDPAKMKAFVAAVRGGTRRGAR